MCYLCDFWHMFNCNRWSLCSNLYLLDQVIMEIPLELMLTISQKLPWMFFPDIIPVGHPIFDIINSTNPEVRSFKFKNPQLDIIWSILLFVYVLWSISRHRLVILTFKIKQILLKIAKTGSSYKVADLQYLMISLRWGLKSLNA